MAAPNRSKTFGDTKASELLGLHGSNNGFIDDFKVYIGALLRTPQNFIARAIHVHNFAETVQSLNDARKGEMIKTLNWCALVRRSTGMYRRRRWDDVSTTFT